MTTFKTIKMKKNIITVHESRSQAFNAGSFLNKIVEVSESFSLLQIFRNIKLRQAIKLLETTDFSNDQIAYIVGFENASIFVENFCKKYCMTPMHYRQNYKKI